LKGSTPGHRRTDIRDTHVKTGLLSTEKCLHMKKSAGEVKKASFGMGV